MFFVKYLILNGIEFSNPGTLEKFRNLHLLTKHHFLSLQSFLRQEADLLHLTAQKS